MARTKQPTQLHSVKGTFNKHPERRPKGEPQPKAGIGKPPKSPATTWRRCWHEIVDQVCPGVLGDSDRMAVEMASRLLAEYRQWGDEMPAARLNVLQSLLASFGMTPSARTKVGRLEPDDDDPASRYF